MKGTSLASNASIYLVSNIINSAIPFFLLPVLTKYLNPLEYGQVAMFQVTIGALASIIGLNAAGAANRHFFESDANDTSIKEFVSTCVQIIFTSAFFIFFVVLIFSKPLESITGLSKFFLYYATLSTTMLATSTLLLNQWQVRKKALTFGIFQISQSLLNMLLSLLFVVVWKNGSAGRIEAQTIALTTFGVVAFFLLKKENLLKFKFFKKQYWSESLHFGVPLIPHVAGNFILTSADRFIISNKLGLSEAGIYMVAVQISMGLVLIFDAINKAYVPWLYNHLKNNIYQQKITIVKLTYLWFFGIVLIMLIGFQLGPLLVKIVAGKDYSRAGDVVGWIIAGQCFLGMYLMITNFIFFSKKTLRLSAVTITSGFLNIALIFLLIPVIGLKGAAIGFCASMAIRFIFAWMVSATCYPMPWFDLSGIRK